MQMITKTKWLLKVFKLAEERARAYLDSPTENHPRDVAQLKLDRALNRIRISMKDD